MDIKDHGAQRAHHYKRVSQTVQGTWVTIHAFPTRGARLPRAHYPHRTLPSVRSRLDFEGNQFADVRSHTIARKGRNMNEDISGAFGRRDESETAVIIPLGQSAVNTHGRPSPRLSRADPATHK